VVDALSSVVLPEQMMLVGAQCRDLLHSRFVGGAPLRRTNDTDVAIAIPDWMQFVSIREKFDTVGDSGHQFRINGIITDLIPFGGVEEPLGASSHPPGHAVMNVHGFQDAFERAQRLPMLEGVSIKIPRLDGYAVLKTHAWLDRSANHEYKDAADLALAVYWYAQNVDMLYDEANIWALEHHDHELVPAAAALLGAAMRQGLGAYERDVLSTRLVSANIDLLALHFGVGKPGWPTTEALRRPLVTALVEQIVS
jgi:predicted nucleotidyltransferase